MLTFMRSILTGKLPCAAGAGEERSATYTAAQLAEVWRLANLPPHELGLPYGQWSLAKLRPYLIQHRVVPTISREHLGRVLKKGGFDYVALSANCSAMSPCVV
jgi:hypothetical protein